MKVYVVIYGEKHEGGSVAHVFADKEKAADYVRDRVASRNISFYGQWREETPSSYWEGGCDFFSVEEHEVMV